MSQKRRQCCLAQKFQITFGQRTEDERWAKSNFTVGKLDKHYLSQGDQSQSVSTVVRHVDTMYCRHNEKWITQSNHEKHQTNPK